MTEAPEAPERGAGLIGTIGGLMVFFVLLSVAVQLMFNLYATSAVTAAAYDAASVPASGDVDRGDPAELARALDEAESRARAVLGEYGERLEFTWDIDDQRVQLTLAADQPSFAVARVSGIFGTNRLERTVEVRTEERR